MSIAHASLAGRNFERIVASRNSASREIVNGCVDGREIALVRARRTVPLRSVSGARGR
jgi:hypothetical protein